jgi:hypothetical protein
MLTRGRLGALVAVLLVVGIAVGPPPKCSANPTVSATQVMTALSAVRKWSIFLYNVGVGEPTCEPSQTPVEELGDGVQRWTIHDGFCIDTTVTSYPDGSYDLDIVNPDAIQEHVESRASDFLIPPYGGPQRVDFVHSLSTGDKAAYTTFPEVVDAGGFAQLLAEHTVGRLTPKHGKPVDFTLERSYDFPPPPDEFTATFSDGTRLQLTIPYDWFIGALDFHSPAVGSIRVQGKTLAFQLVSDDPDKDPRWNRLVVGSSKVKGKATAENGQFALDRGFAGHGQMFRGRKLEYAASWNSAQVAQVVLPTGQASSAGPAAGLIDFLHLRWSGLASQFGPTPGL